ncbi:MAG: chromosome partitioning protein ParA [Prevotella sp.]|nr:chromosome partitioning protein ParA [Prevotella sp.]
MNKNTESFITIVDLWRMCVARWRWFAVSILICMLFAERYLIVTPKQYTRYASIMLREESLGNNVTEKNGNEFNEIGFVKQKNNVTNVVRHITSLDVLIEVVKRLQLPIEDSEIITKAEEIQSRLSAEIEDLGSTIISLTYKDFSTEDAERVLNLVIQVYNDKWLQEKHYAIENTSQFIDSRLKLLERDLNIVDDSISSYKSRYGITEIARVSDIYLQQQSKADADILTLMNQKAMAEYIQSLLDEKTSQKQLLLVNSGINNSLIESQITLYNSLLLQMQSHLEYTSGQNPLIINLEKELNSLRKNIYASVNNHIRTIDIQLRSLQSYHGKTTSKITSNPSQAKHLLSIEREQKVKESLYMYLLQKKEENEISITYKTAPTQIIDVPNGSKRHTSPSAPKVLLAAFLLGLLAPVAVIFLRATMDESVRDRFDIERNSDIPFLGEVPYSGREHSLESLLMRFGIGRKAKSSGIVVGPDVLNASNEAFRVLRNNMDSIVENKFPGKGARVYLLKSTQIEVGKTFVGMNLSLVKAIGGQRVLFIDGDLRQASASRLWRTPLLGLSDYLCGDENDYRKLLWHPEGYPMLDVLPAGALPTNPTELLQSPLLVELIDTVRQHYDSVFIDSPSASILADADIVERTVDSTLFVIRAGRFNRHRLGELSPIEIINGTSKPQYIILNGVDINVRYGYAYSHKYERSEEDKNIVELSKTSILLNKIIFKKKQQKS